MTKPFLQIVAEDLYNRFGSELNNISIVFPSKRANLFFNEYLATLSPSPVWAPRYQTITELFLSLSDRTVCDPIEAVCLLHQVYQSIVPTPMDMDAFYGWGEKLLKDFDDLDKNLVAADLLFKNLSAIKEIENRNFLSQEQEKALSDFFSDFSIEKNSFLRQRFLDIWNALLPLYENFNRLLQQKGVGYEGALFRSVINRIENTNVEKPTEIQGTYVFVGFNLLSAVERRLMKMLQTEHKALFYWDYDTYFVGDNPSSEAGTFIRQNLQEFGSALTDESLFRNFNRPKQMEIISSLYDSEQASYVGDWLSKNCTTNGRNTGIVLCDENMLLPVMHAIPSNVKELNVTKGFPLCHTPAFSRIEKFFQDHAKGDTKACSTEDQLLFLQELKEITQKDALENSTIPNGTTTREDDILKQLYAESDFQCYKILCQIERLLIQGTLKISFITFHRLLRHLLRQTNIPFHGEPAKGVQILGMLETRCLDFDHILMLSVGENILPPSLHVSSFIPDELRRAFGMTTSEHEISIYAYYFYRILSRASHITFVYNANATGASTGEMSRFLLQLQVESGQSIKLSALHSPCETIDTGISPIEKIEKDERIFNLLKKRENKDSSLSPSAINRWLTCRLSFYFRYIVGLPEPEPDKDVIQPNVLGTLFHAAAEIFYRKLTEGNKHITKSQLESYTKDNGHKLSSFVAQAFKHENIPYQIIIASVIQRYLHSLISADYHLAPFDMEEMETDHYIKLSISTVNGMKEVLVGGRVDRIDLVKNPIDGRPMMRVVDYKTGGQMEYPMSMDSLFSPSEKRAHYAFQVFLYSLTLCEEAQWPIAPSLFFVNHVHAKDFSPYLSWGKEKTPVYDFQLYKSEYLSFLKKTVEEIFSMDEPFTPTTISKYCEYCPYHDLCRR